MEDATLGIRRQGLGGAEVIKRKERLLSAVLLSQAIAFCIALTSLSSTLLASKVRFASQSAYLGIASLQDCEGHCQPHWHLPSRDDVLNNLCNLPGDLHHPSVWVLSSLQHGCSMQGLSLPAAQTIPNYALLAAVYGALQLLQRQKPQNGMGGYAAVAILDVEANFLVVSSWPCFPSAHEVVMLCHVQ